MPVDGCVNRDKHLFTLNMQTVYELARLIPNMEQAVKYLQERGILYLQRMCKRQY